MTTFMKTFVAIWATVLFSLMLYLGAQTYVDHRAQVAWGAKFDAWAECNHGPNWDNCEHLRP
jgi:predicted secreted protein